MDFITGTALIHLVLLAMATALRADHYNSFISNDSTNHHDRARRQGGYREMVCGPTDRHFNYNPASSSGPNNWWRTSSCCGGQLQSPIPLVLRSAQCFTVDSPYYFATPTLSGKLRNTGHNVQLSGLSSAGQRSRLSNVGNMGSQAVYVLDSVHIHFGNSFSRGSEHTIDGEQFQGEIHMVHYKEEYGSVESAMMRRDGLAVIGILLSSFRGDSNTQLQDMVHSIQNLQGVGDWVPFSLNPNLLLPIYRDLYYYHGSLTTPSCSESVQFMIMKQPLLLTQAMLQTLWSLPSDELGVPISRYTNVRPMQPVNSRTVRTNFIC